MDEILSPKPNISPSFLGGECFEMKEGDEKDTGPEVTNRCSKLALILTFLIVQNNISKS